MTTQKINEAMDRSYLLTEFIQTMLCQHEAIKENKEILDEVERAQLSLSYVYEKLREELKNKTH